MDKRSFQHAIADQIRQSFTKRRKAKELMSLVIETVELAIPNDDNMALDFILDDFPLHD